MTAMGNVKRILRFACAAVLIIAAFCAAAAAAESQTGNDADFMALLNQYRQEGKAEFEISLTKDYFDEIRADSYAKYTVLKLRCGMAEEKLRYTFSGDLLFSEVKWREPHVAECENDADVAEAIRGFLDSETGEFQLVCGKELSEALQKNNHIFVYMGWNGIEDFGLKYNFSYPRVYYFENIRKSSIPWALAEDPDSFRNAVDYMWRENAGHFFIMLDPDFYHSLQGDRETLQILEASTQMEDWKSKYNNYYCRYEFTDVTYSPEPRLLCNTEEDIQDSVRRMGASGITSFRLVMSRELYDAVRGNSFKRLQELTSDAGMSSGDMKYSFMGTVVVYSDAVIHSDVVRLTSPEEAMAYTTDCVAKGEKEISLFCSEELYKLLIANISPFSFSNDSMAPLFDVTAYSGIFDFTFSYSSATHVITLHVENLYPGTNILRAVNSGDESALTDRERETLKQAQSVADSCRKDTPLETARAVHDWLCEKNTYVDDDGTDEDDTAIGAILNGEANCDGYADAFCLLGRLAGLNVRYQHGDSYNIGLTIDFLNSVTHMWNLVEIDGSWRLVDVTWDDSEEGIQYTWFNLGEDRAKRMHIWNAETSVALLAQTDLSVRPENEYLVSTAEETEAAVRDAVNRGFTDFELIYADEAGEDHHGALNILSHELPSSYRYSWNERMLTLSVYR